MTVLVALALAWPVVSAVMAVYPWLLIWSARYPRDGGQV